jgi:hypothetical protein
MRKRTTVLAAFAAFLVAACATTDQAIGKLPDKSCNGDCDVDVDPSMGTVPDKVTVSNGRGKKIRWTIRPNQGSFAQNGIEFDESGRRVFTNCAAGANMRMFTCDNGGAPGQYKYTVRIQGRPAVDPFIINR